jgi:hypothetical protein
MEGHYLGWHVTAASIDEDIAADVGQPVKPFQERNILLYKYST